MNKTFLLMIPAMAILLTGCSASTCNLFMASGNSQALIDSNAPVPLSGDVDRGLHLPLTTRSSMNIDVECILDYVQGESAFLPEKGKDYFLNPWVRFDLSF